MKTIFRVPSVDGVHTLAGVVYQPSGEIRGFFHVVHGMTEHIGRYDRLMTEMAERGYLTFGYDHLGHGNTARDESELGFIASEGGENLLAQDVKIFSDAVFSAYRRTDEQPYYLLGHSMGSFVTRLAVEKYVKPDRYIIMGTGGKNAAAGAGLALIAVLKLFFGERHISPLMEKLAFGSYNKRFGGGTAEDPSPWLTRDEEERRKYYADPFCTFKFTLSAMGNLIRLMRDANRNAWYHNMPHIPILVVSGKEDPVGNYGQGVRSVCDALERQGHMVRCVLYPGARHEILNDTTYPQVKADILAFIEDDDM